MSRNYPDDFNMPIFPAGPRVAVSRVMGIAVMVVFALIIAVCGMIFWASRAQHVHPFLLAIDDVTGAWMVVGHDHGERTTTANLAMQESVIANFTKNWFTVSADQSENDRRWSGFANKSECNANNRAPGADIYCTGGDSVYKFFSADTVIDYQVMVAAGETWSVDIDNIYLNQTTNVNDNGGTWRVLTRVDSNLYGPIQIMAYVTLARDVRTYPQTLGFYVADFNAYRVDSE